MQKQEVSHPEFDLWRWLLWPWGILESHASGKKVSDIA